MAKLRLHPIAKSLRGKMGDIVFKKRGSKGYIASSPDAGPRETTPPQAANQQRFRQAAAYGKMVLADPQARAAYDDAAKAQETGAYALMVGDFLYQPEVNEINLTQYTRQAGSKILVSATDDVEVTGVHVTIRNNQVIESGAATTSLDDPGRWVYTATANTGGGALTIDATATDRPGHKTTKSEMIH